MSEFPVLSRLLASNAQWAKDVSAIEPKFHENAAKGQSPKVLWIGCADSRVPESVVLAVKPGEIFVHRNIANQFHSNDDSALSVLTYAVENLGVEHVIVVGHTKCGGAAGAFAAACAPPAPEGQSSPDTPLTRWLAPLIKLAKSLRISTVPPEDAVPILVNASVEQQVKNVAATSIMENAWASGKKVWVHGWVYEIEHGTLKDLGVTVAPPRTEVRKRVVEEEY